jgi:hypothetical protein
MKRRMIAGVLALSLASLSTLWASASSDASPLWTFPFATHDQMAVAPSGSILDGECTNIQPDGSELWTLPPSSTGPRPCEIAVSDSAGNSYIFGRTSQGNGEGVVEAVDSSGHMIWSVPIPDYFPAFPKPVLGANGDVYFLAYNGRDEKLIGIAEGTGAVTLEREFSLLDGLSTYGGGLVVQESGGPVIYLSYEGAINNYYGVAPEISANEAWSGVGGADGDFFVAGYGPTCGSGGHASVEKFTPAGRAWTWTDSGEYCASTNLAATPDGGVILGRGETTSSADYTSLGPNGHERWTDDLNLPAGTRNLAGYLPVEVDINGTATLVGETTYVCVSPGGECPGAQVRYVSASTGATVLPELLVTGSPEGRFDISNYGTFTERTFISGEFSGSDSPEERVIMSFKTPGLGKNYQLVLQEALTEAGPPAPPPPTLPVTISDDGGGGVAGAPDPGSAGGGGSCDPGADTNWLHIAGVTFTCIVSGDVWNEPDLISAKNRCIIKLGIDFLPFTKALKLPKYVAEADEVKASIRLLAKSTASAAYPGKTASDAKALGDLETALEGIKNPKEALLTVISSDRVLDGLIAKLGKGGSAAAQLARKLAVLKTAISTLVETVTGIQDIKDCMTAAGVS